MCSCLCAMRGSTLLCALLFATALLKPFLLLARSLSGCQRRIAHRHFSVLCRSMSVDALLELVPKQNPASHVYIIIHNVDSHSICTPGEMTALSRLAACPNVHLLASVEHANAASLWDLQQSEMFQWLWHHIPTLEPLWLETMASTAVLASTAHHQTQQSASVVLAMLTPSSRSVPTAFNVIALLSLLESRLIKINIEP